MSLREALLQLLTDSVGPIPTTISLSFLCLLFLLLDILFLQHRCLGKYALQNIVEFFFILCSQGYFRKLG